MSVGHSLQHPAPRARAGDQRLGPPPREPGVYAPQEARRSRELHERSALAGIRSQDPTQRRLDPLGHPRPGEISCRRRAALLAE